MKKKPRPFKPEKFYYVPVDEKDGRPRTEMLRSSRRLVTLSLGFTSQYYRIAKVKLVEVKPRRRK